jgi:hypothetical protein
MQNTQVFYDEEECLGFGVFVAELELVVGTSKGRRPDQTVLLELLQKLQTSIISTRDSASLKQHQKRCEAALYDIIYKGSCAAVSHGKGWAGGTATAADSAAQEQVCPGNGQPVAHISAITGEANTTSMLLQVCSLVNVCLSRLYTTGDLLPLYARVNGLQAFLQDRNSTAPEASVCW